MEKKLLKKSYSITAGCILLLYSLYNIVDDVCGLISGSETFSFSFFAYMVSLLILSFMLLMRKNNLATIILLGIVTLIYLYWGTVALLNLCWYAEELPYQAEYFDTIELLWPILELFSFISAKLLIIISVIAYKKASDSIKKLWFIPAVFELLYIILLIVIYKGYELPFTNYIGIVIKQSIYCAGIAFTGLALCSTDGKSLESTSEVSNNTQTANDGYCDMTKHILLLFFINSIWQFVWIFRTTEYLNKTPNEEKRNPATKMLLCMFVPFYYIYWTYQSARRIDILAKEKNIYSDITSLSVVLSFFVNVVPPIIMQSKLNQICKYENQATVVQNVEHKVEINCDKTDEIRNYKKLLDDGIITEEEFEAKKKQLLGL